MRPSRLLRAWATACVVASLALAAAGPAASRLPDAAARAVDRISADELHQYVETLASDAFAGRGVGEAGNRAAESFICRTLQQNGVTPAGEDRSCYQTVALNRPAPGSHAALTVTAADGTTALDITSGAEFYPLPESGSADASGPLLFAGHGITSAGHRDDYAGLDARGAVVLILDGAPDDLRGPDSSTPAKIENAAVHGVRGVLIVSDSLADRGLIWPAPDSPRTTAYRLAAEMREAPVVALLSAHSAEPVRAALSAHARLNAVIRPDVAGTPVVVHNVLGIVDGRDPAKRGELIVVGAHLDHDGTDAQGRIYNGADDNASGTAAVLASAIAFARAAEAGERPGRPVLFALWNGEEKGSLGAEAFVRNPPPDRRIVANLNLDMVGRHEEVRDPGDWRFMGLPKVDASSSVNTLHVLGYSYTPDLAAELRDANQAIGLTLLEDYDRGAQDLLKRSDNWPFLAHGIPALFLTTGLHPDYHTPDDDTARIDFGKLARVARLAARAAWIVADGPAPAVKKF